ncbi:uncharacterized protein CDV56_103753 [Aspergillus thermomutatus]|uniref:Regulator of rDNA transcription protein 8 n=1 Tax=Aspergillus thermomutatus TaxID=41047 RepID=A0A397I386_ASPTH|nr:uncharacterized protein CDV56_103753 [Aspergillus thermomutatus]RHZ68276.1 hypothetical protein CDV56_103753 [Aspergillus thermomutatus]
MADKMKDALHEEANNFKAVAHDVAVSGAYLYPVKGILYFSYHKDLWRPFLSRAVQTIGLGLGVTTAMFFFTYVPQAAIMTFTSGPLAPISAALLVLSESSTITNFLARSFVLADALTDTFDGTLVTRGHTELVAHGRQIKGPGGGAVSRLGKMLNRPLERMRPSALVRSLMLLPLNFIPVVGTLLYVYMQGKKIGPVAHSRYFQLKGWDERRREEWVRRNRGGYTGLGVAAFLFEMVPFASLVFSFTNTVGAALWAADLEKTMQ